MSMSLSNMSNYYQMNNRNYSSQEDDNFGLSEEDSTGYLDHDQMKTNRSVNKESDEYKKRREKNNEAVRRSREKAKVKYNEKEEQILKLRKENKRLESTAANLRSELKIYQDLAQGLDIQIYPNDPNLNCNRMIKLERDVHF